ncbi:MAG: MarR family winged helix-turn-helix transcriptional regulator [Thermocrispum sp.]
MRVDLAFLLNQAAYAFSAQLGAALADLGITVRDFCVLLKAAEEERTQNVVAELAMLDKTTMVATLDGLERAGLAERRVSSSDRRARMVAVTAKGRRLLDKAVAAVDGAVDDALSVLDPADRDAFLRSLTALTDGPWATPFHVTVPQRRRQVRPAQEGT